MLDEFGLPFIEGGLAGLDPADIEFFCDCPACAGEGAGRSRLRLDHGHRSHSKPSDDPNLRELVTAETPVVTIFGKQELGCST